MSEGIRLGLEGSVARVTLDRPPLNILTTAMLRALADSLLSAASSPGVRLIRLDAEGKAFSAGVDVADHVGDKVRSMMEALLELFEALDRVEQPTVSVVQGAALGGGCELVLGTDLCLASTRATFGQPEIRLGLFAPPASVLLPRCIGERRALELLLTGETLSAERAERLGLVNRVYDEDRFAPEVDGFFNGLLEHSDVALRQTKRAVRAARQRSVVDGYREVNRLYLEELMRSEDAHEGLRAFIEKRRPTWSHR